MRCAFVCQGACKSHSSPHTCACAVRVPGPVFVGQSPGDAAGTTLLGPPVQRSPQTPPRCHLALRAQRPRPSYVRAPWRPPRELRGQQPARWLRPLARSSRPVAPVVTNGVRAVPCISLCTAITYMHKYLHHVQDIPAAHSQSGQTGRHVLLHHVGSDNRGHDAGEQRRHAEWNQLWYGHYHGTCAEGSTKINPDDLACAHAEQVQRQRMQKW